MNRNQAKEILLLYRPGTRDGEDPEVAEAMEFARRDPELATWFEQHKAFQMAMRAKFKEIEVPEHLKRALLPSRKIVRPPVFWQRQVWLAAAAIFVLFLGFTLIWFKPSVPDRFSHYRETMVSAAVRAYGMDLETRNMNELRQYISTNGAPADYDLTQGLAKLDLKGGGLLRWRSNPVSMVCFDRGAGSTLFLFVMKRSALKDPPSVASAQAELAQVDGLQTASWTRGDDTYVLAGPSEAGFAQKYLSQ